MTRRALWLLLSLLIVQGTCAPGGPEVEVHLSGLSPDVASLSVTATLGAGPSPWGSQTVSGRLDLFYLDLPAGTHGPLSVRIAGLSSAGCLVADDTAGVALGQGGSYQIKATLKAQPDVGCRLLIQSAGLGHGTFRWPAGPWQCPTPGPCRLKAPAGTFVELFADPDAASYFTGWSGACSGTASCQVRIGEGGQSVQASFALRKNCVAGFCWENPLPLGQDLQQLFSFSAGDIWAVGNGGTILHYNGSLWTVIDSGTTRTLHGIWGSGPQDLWAVGDGGTVLRYDGTAFSRVDAGVTGTLYGVFGFGPADVWFVGASGTVLHHDGATFSPVDNPASANLNRVWGSGPADVWIVGDRGTVLHADGGSLSAVHTPLPATQPPALGAVFGIGATVWVAGAQGTLLRWDGQKFVRVPLDPGLSVMALWGFADGPSVQLWLTALDDTIGRVLHGDGTTFSEVDTGSKNAATSLWGSAGDLWIAGWGGLLSHYNGSFATLVTSGPEDLLLSVWGAGPTDVWAAGLGQSLLHYNGTAWLLTPPPPAAVRGLFGFATADVWAVGSPGALSHFDGTSWTTVDHLPSGALLSVWGTGAKDLWAVGSLEGTTGLLAHYDGHSLTRLPYAGPNLERVWGLAQDDVWIVGTAGTVLHYDGTTWLPVAISAGSADLYGVWGSGPNDLWIVGTAATVRHFDGTSWQPVNCHIGVGTDPQSVWGSGPADVYIAGFSGGTTETLYHFDGRACTPIPGLPDSLIQVWGTGKDDVYLIGAMGTILHKKPAGAAP